MTIIVTSLGLAVAALLAVLLLGDIIRSVAQRALASSEGREMAEDEFPKGLMLGSYTIDALEGQPFPERYTWHDDGSCTDYDGGEWGNVCAMGLEFSIGSRIALNVEFLEGEIYSIVELDYAIEALSRLRDQLKAGELPQLQGFLDAE